MILPKQPQDRRHQHADHVMGHAEADLARELDGQHLAHHLVVQRDDAMRRDHQALPAPRQPHRGGVTLEQRRAEQIFQPLDLLADRALAAVHELRGRRHAAGLGHRHE